jgi:hypothetical protein
LFVIAVVVVLGTDLCSKLPTKWQYSGDMQWKQEYELKIRLYSGIGLWVIIQSFKISVYKKLYFCSLKDKDLIQEPISEIRNERCHQYWFDRKNGSFQHGALYYTL